MIYNIGIIGKGFVGSAVSHGFSNSVGYKANIRIYDKDKSKSLNSLKEVVTKSEFVFISDGIQSAPCRPWQNISRLLFPPSLRWSHASLHIDWSFAN